MKKAYSTPSLDVRKYKLLYNSVFTESGDPRDDDEYDLDGGAGANVNDDIFGS